MADISIKDEEAYKVLAQGIRNLIEKNAEEFLGLKSGANASYYIREAIARTVKDAIEKIAREEAAKYVEHLQFRDQIKAKVEELINKELFDKLISRMRIETSTF